MKRLKIWDKKYHEKQLGEVQGETERKGFKKEFQTPFALLSL